MSRRTPSPLASYSPLISPVKGPLQGLLSYRDKRNIIFDKYIEMSALQPVFTKRVKKRRQQQRRMKELRSTKQVARRALRMVRQIKKGIERKLIQTVETNSNIGSTPTRTLISGVTRGDSAVERDGSQITMVNIRFKALLKKHASATNTNVRLMLVQDSQTNGANFATADLLSDTSADDCLVSTRNLDNMKRFRVLMDRLYHLNDTSPSAYITYYKDLKIKCRYSGNAGTIADINDNSIFLVEMSDEATNTPTITYHCNIRFVDA